MRRSWVKSGKKVAGLLGLCLVLFWPYFASGADLKLKKKSGEIEAFLGIGAEAPGYGPPPRGFLYGGPYPPPYPYYPYPYYPWPPGGNYPPPPFYGHPYEYPPNEYDEELIPAGRLSLLVDPVDAKVFVDGLRLQQRSDLSYEVGLLVGEHTVRVQAEGYEPYERTVKIQPARQLYMTIRLERAP